MITMVHTDSKAGTLIYYLATINNDLVGGYHASFVGGSKNFTLGFDDADSKIHFVCDGDMN